MQTLDNKQVIEAITKIDGIQGMLKYYADIYRTLITRLDDILDRQREQPKTNADYRVQFICDKEILNEALQYNHIMYDYLPHIEEYIANLNKVFELLHEYKKTL